MVTHGLSPVGGGSRPWVRQLDTPRYWDFCMRYAGAYLHHVPHLPEERADQPMVLYATIQAIRAAGFPLDDELWGAQDVKCHQCHACCTDSPK
jgi:hypothetical protein